MSKVYIILISVAVFGLLAEAALEIDNEPELREAQAALFSVNSKSGWVLLNYVDPKTVHFAAGGEGDSSDLLAHLEDGQIQYGLLRLVADSNIRDVFITWIGPEVDANEKRMKSRYLVNAEAFLEPYHSAITVLNRDNFNDETVIDRSNPLSGSRVID